MEKISKATERNWKKLNVVDKKMEKRANKRMSKKHIIPNELFKDTANVNKVVEIIDYIKKEYIDENITTIIYNLSLNYLIMNNLLDKSINAEHNNVKNYLRENCNIKILNKLLNIELPENENDILGIIYQCLLTEGEKNERGSYYTPANIVCDMLKKVKLTDNDRILDPCCGTGMFLLGVKTKNPSNIYGIDNDKNAVLISKVNLMVKYRDVDFEPNIFIEDFIKDKKISISNIKFNYIITNPPWGANLDEFDKSSIKEIKSGESFSYILYRASKMLEDGGKLLFLLPESFLNVKVHSDIRKYLITNMSFNKITLYPTSFSGVVTKFISIYLENSIKHNNIIKINDTKNDFFEKIDDIKKSANYVITLNTKIDKNILKKIERVKSNNLSNSKWGLGIVTGNNKKKLKKKKTKELEPIYTGKEIAEYKLLECKNYIKYNKDELQQVASDEIYRAKEKLVYKFISKKITFAYDDKQSLFLNSANILIPNIPNMSTKTVMAFLNSTVFQYMYIQKFGEIKVLKGNLEQLPIPIISKEDNEYIEQQINNILSNKKEIKESKDNIEERIFNIYELSEDEIKHIKEVVNGKFN